MPTTKRCKAKGLTPLLRYRGKAPVSDKDRGPGPLSVDTTYGYWCAAPITKRYWAYGPIPLLSIGAYGPYADNTSYRAAGPIAIRT